MTQEARLFGDDGYFLLIMETLDPREHKRLGRNISSVGHAAWDRGRVNIALVGN